MAFKATVTGEEFAALEEVVQAWYVKDESSEEETYRLDAEKLADKMEETVKKNKDLTAKIGEFRRNNVTLTNKVKEYDAQYKDVDLEKIKEMETALAEFKGVDLAEYKKLKEEHDKIKNKQLLDEGKIEELLAAQQTQLSTQFERQMEELRKAMKDAKAELQKTQRERDKAHEALNTGLVDVAFHRAAEDPQLGLQSGSINLILPVAREHFEVKDGEVVSRTDGSTVTAYLTEFVKDKPYLLKASNGGGTLPGKHTVTTGGAVTISATDARDPMKYRAAKKQAEERGAELVMQE